MDIYSWTFVNGLIILTVVLTLCKKIVDSRNSPPGPWGLPFIGSLLKLNKENALLVLQEYKARYGKIFSLSVGNFDVIVLNDYKLIQEALKKEEFLGRPDFETWTIRNRGYKNRGILFTDGNAHWNEQRRFALRNLRDFGFGKHSMSDLLVHEVQELIQNLKKVEDQPINLKNNFNCSVLNSLWFILTGTRFELDDPEFRNVITLFTGHLDKLTIFSPANYFPWPARKNLVRPGLWAKSMNMVDQTLALVDRAIDEHLRTYDDAVQRDFLDIYLHQHKRSTHGSSFFDEEGLQNLRITLLDLFAAGTETTATTLLWTVWFLAKNPKIEEKLHGHIQQVIGGDRLPTRDDKFQMPYLEAFTNEVHRMAALIPMSVYHKVVRDCEFGGYLFKKGVNVYPNIYDAHYDKEFWSDPEQFRPERFLDASGTKLIHKDALMPFSTGKRICLGETLARDSLFFFICGLVQNFKFELDSSSLDIDQDIPKPNFIRSPHEYNVILKSR